MSRTLFSATSQRLDKRKLLYLLIAGLAILILTPQFSAFQGSLAALTSPNVPFLILALVFTALSYPAAAGVYVCLSTKYLGLKRTTMISTGASFASRLLPAGAGAIAMNVRYLQKAGYKISVAGSLAALNNLIGSIGHFGIICVLIIVTDTRLRDVFVVRPPRLVVLVISVAVLFSAVVILSFSKLRHKAFDVVKEILREISALLRQPLRFFGALLCALAITSCYGLALYFSAKAVDVPISLLGALLVLTVGLTTASATPTPGGIGGAEAGLVAAFVSTGVTADAAFAATILYRLCTYWLPIIPGFIAFNYAQAKRYI